MTLMPDSKVSLSMAKLSYLESLTPSKLHHVPSASDNHIKFFELENKRRDVDDMEKSSKAIQCR